MREHHQEQQMLRACQQGNVARARRLLDAGASANAITRGCDFGAFMCNYSALHLAAESGSVPIIQALVARGADVHFTDPELHSTPLHMAASNGHAAACAALLDAGAGVDAHDHKQETPLRHAARARHSTTCALLLDRGAVFDTVAVHCCLQSFAPELAFAIARRGQLDALREGVATFGQADPQQRAYTQFWLRAHAARRAATQTLQAALTP